MGAKVLILPGDHIGPEIVAEAVKVLGALQRLGAVEVELEEALIGGAALDAHGVPLPDSTLAAAQAADAILLGSVGGPVRERAPECGQHPGVHPVGPPERPGGPHEVLRLAGVHDRAGPPSVVPRPRDCAPWPP